MYTLCPLTQHNLSFLLMGQAHPVNCWYAADKQVLVCDSHVSAGLYVHPGLFFTNGVEWKEQRTTSLEILRRLGMGKNVLADRIQEEVTHYIRAIQQHQGAPVDLQHLTQTSVSNNIMSIVFGKRFEYDDPDFKKYIHAMDDTMGSLTG